MDYFRNKPIVVTAIQWKELGDHPDVFRHSFNPIDKFCSTCGKPNSEHGTLRQADNYTKICPGDYITKDKFGKEIAVKLEDFIEVFEPIELSDPLVEEYKNPPTMLQF